MQTAERQPVDRCPIPRNVDQVNIKWLAGQYETYGFPVAARVDALREHYRGNPTQRIIDLYALSVPAIRKIGAIAQGHRPDRGRFGLVTGLSNGNIHTVEHLLAFDPYSQIRESMAFTIGHAADEYFSKDSLASRFAASEHAANNHQVLELPAEPRGGANSFVKQGIDTAANIMPSTLRLIPALYCNQFKQSPDADSASQIAKDNYPFLSQLAIAQLIPFVAVTDIAGGRGKKAAKPDRYEFVENLEYPGGLELQYTDATKEAVLREVGGWLHDPIEGLRIRL
jgi:hypothetical protein